MRRPLISLLIAEAVSLTGSRVSLVAVPWLVLITTHSPIRVGIVTFAQALPFVLTALLSGPLIDRLGPRSSALACDCASAATVALIPLLHSLGLLSYGLLLSAVALAGALGGCSDTAKRTLLPRVAHTCGTPMTRASALYDGVGRAATLIGVPLGGALIAGVGSATVLTIDAASFAVGAGLMALGVRPAEAGSQDDPVREKYSAALRTGLAYFRRDGLVAAIMLMLFVTNLLDQAFTVVFVPIWVLDVQAGPSTLGLLGGAFGLGAVIGNVAYTAVAPRLRRHPTFALCFLLGGSTRLFALALSDTLWVVLAVAFGAGLAFAAVNPILFAFGYERIPVRLQGRVLGAIGALAWAGIPVGGLLGGLSVNLIGLRPALLAAAACYLAMTLTPFIFHRWRDLDDPSPMTPTRMTLS